MDTSIRIYRSHEAMKADEYRYWRGRSVEERMDAVKEITLAIYAMKHGEPEADVSGLQGPLVRLQRPRR